MEYYKYTPHVLLQPFIECYYLLQSAASLDNFIIESPPSAYSALVFDLSPYNRKEQDSAPRAFIAGQQIKNYSMTLNGAIDHLGIVFKPTGLFHLFDLAMYEITGLRIDAEDVLKNAARKLIERLSEQKSKSKRVEIVEEFLLHQLSQAKSDNLDGVDLAVQAIIERKGVVDVKELIRISHMSRRSFERHFYQRVGLSPKYYARIRRYGYVCSVFSGERTVDWNRVLHSVGYFDQSHLIKDFREFSGKSPGSYLKTNQELAHFVNL